MRVRQWNRVCAMRWTSVVAQDVKPLATARRLLSCVQTTIV